MFKNFIFLFAFALIPSYFFAMSVDLRSLEKIASNLLAADVDVTFATVFNSVSLINGARWPFGLVCLASMAVCMPMLLAFIEKHMRIGSRSLKGLFGRINYNFLSTVVLLLLALAVYELWALLVSGLVYASILLFDGAARFIAAVIVAAGMVLLLSYIFMQVWLWLPCLHITGYSYMDALAFSSQALGSNKKQLYLAVMLPYVAGMILILTAVGVCSRFDIVVPVFVLVELIFILLFLYFNVLMFTAYFDAAGEEREDLKKHF